MRVREEERGYSLVEMLVVLVILGVVLGGLTTVFVSGSKAELDLNKRFQSQQSARLTLSKLRIDAHVAGCADNGSTGATNGTGTGLTQLFLYATALPAPVSVTNCSSNTTTQPTISSAWCTTASSTVTGRYALYRVTGADCSNLSTKIANRTALLYADGLTKNTLFDITWPTSSSKRRPTVKVDLPVDVAKNAKVGLYELIDTISLRNANPA